MIAWRGQDRKDVLQISLRSQFSVLIKFSISFLILHLIVPIIEMILWSPNINCNLSISFSSSVNFYFMCFWLCCYMYIYNLQLLCLPNFFPISFYKMSCLYSKCCILCLMLVWSLSTNICIPPHFLSFSLICVF